MKKYIKLLFMVLCMATLLAGCGGDTSEGKGKPASKIEEKKEKDKDKDKKKKDKDKEKKKDKKDKDKDKKKDKDKDQDKDNKKENKKDSAEYTEYGIDDFNESKVSDDYIIGICGMPSWGDYYECLGYTIKVTADGEVIYYVGSDEVGRMELEKDVLEEFLAALDLEEIATLAVYHPDPYTIDDGGSNYIVIYGKDDEPYVTRGGFCVDGEDFWDYYKLVLNLTTYEWREECFDDYVSQLEDE